MLPTRGYAAAARGAPLAPFSFQRRDPGPADVLIEILWCGICHSDIHQARGEWGPATFPMVPGHEIIGRVARAGAAVTRFRQGDAVGVGCFVDSCRECANCRDGLEQYCDVHTAYTYNGTEQDGRTPTYGGYSSQIVVDEHYVLRIPDRISLAAAAPLLCAGITTYSPLRHLRVGAGMRVGVIGLGGLGHMGVKLAAAMGAEVTVLSTSPSKEADTRRLGAHHFVATGGRKALSRHANHFDTLLDTVSAPHDFNAYLNLLRRDGHMVLVGVPERPAEVEPFSIIRNRRSLMGSSIGGVAETQEMLDFCGARSIAADVEVVPIAQVNAAYERTVKGDVRYRFVIDLKTL